MKSRCRTLKRSYPYSLTSSRRNSHSEKQSSVQNLQRSSKTEKIDISLSELRS